MYPYFPDPKLLEAYQVTLKADQALLRLDADAEDSALHLRLGSPTMTTVCVNAQTHCARVVL
jgi:hypothetical protein